MDPLTASVVAGIPPGTLIERMGMEVVQVSAEGGRATMPVAGNTQRQGLLHGGATAALVETIGSLAAGVHAGPESVAMGVDLNITHHRAVAEGVVTAIATQLHGGRTLAAYQVDVTDGQGRRIATGRITCALRPRPASG